MTGTETIQISQATINSTSIPEPKLPTFNRDFMKEQINYWHSLGCTVVPFRHNWNTEKAKWEKTPVIAPGQFEEWKQRPQTLEEFNNQPFDRYQMFGVLIGTPITVENPATGQTVTVHPVVIDTDRKGEGYTPTLAEKQNEFHKLMPVTRYELTINNGEHRTVFNLKPPQPSARTEYGHVEYICGPGWVVMGGSIGYTLLNDNQPTIVGDAFKLFTDACDLAGLKQGSQTSLTKQRNNTCKEYTASTVPLKRPCIYDIFEKKQLKHGGSHLFRVAAAAQFKADGLTTEQIIDRFRAQEGFDLDEVLKGINSVKPGQPPHKCETINRYGYCLYPDDPTECPWRQQFKKQQQKETVNPVNVAKKILTKHHFIIDKESRQLYVYDETEGLYLGQTIADEVIRREIITELNDETREHYHKDIRYYIMGEVSKTSIRSVSANPDLILVGNGILNIETMQLQPYSPDVYLINKIPWNYDPNATCPKIDAFEDQTIDKTQQLIFYEFLGDCLQPTNKYKRSYIAVGPTDTGKTQQAKILMRFLDWQNITSHTIQEINHDKNAPSDLYQKLLNIGDDTSSSILRATGVWKTITGGGAIMGRPMYQKAFQFFPYCKFWMNCNNLPAINRSEDDDSYYNRLLPQKYERTVAEKDKIPNFADTITTPQEMSGLLNKAIEGLKRLRIQNGYTETMTTSEKKAFYIREAAPERYFIEQNLEFTNSDDDEILQDDLYRILVDFWKQDGIKKPIPSQGVLIKAMREYCPAAQRLRIRISAGTDSKGKETKKQVWAYRYVKVKSVQPVQLVQPFSNSSEEKKEVIGINGENIGKLYKDPAQLAQPAQTKNPLFSADAISCDPIPAIERKFNQLCPTCHETRDQVWLVKYLNGNSEAVCNGCGSRVLEQLQRKEEVLAI